MDASTWPPLTETYHTDVYPAIDPSQAALDCSNKTVVVTGAGAGVGKGIARAFAIAHAKGIALLGRTLSTLEQTAAEVTELSGGKTKPVVVVTDVTKREEVDRAFQTASAELGNRLDVLVCNAGGANGFGDVTDCDPAEFWGTMELNILGSFNPIQAFAKQQTTSAAPKADRTVIYISSGAAHHPYTPKLCAYSSSKLAATKLFDNLHWERPDWHIFNVQPGVVVTERTIQDGRQAFDTRELPGAFVVWLVASPAADRLRGRFIWANWDVDQLLAKMDELDKVHGLTIGLEGWGTDWSLQRMVDSMRAGAKASLPAQD